MDNINVVIIGYGKLAKNLMPAWLKQEALTLHVCSPSLEKHVPDELKHVAISHQNLAFIKRADVIILAVKPHVLTSVLTELAPEVQNHSLIISLAAGTLLTTLEQPLTGKTAIARAMPNITAKLGLSPVPCVINNHVTTVQQDILKQVIQPLGQYLLLDSESQMNLMTAIVGSGPAFLYEFILGLQSACQQHGLSAEHAKVLCLQMIEGATELAKQSQTPLSHLQQQITSKGGTTEAGLTSLRNNNFQLMVSNCIDAAINKATNMGSAPK